MKPHKTYLIMGWLICTTGIAQNHQHDESHQHPEAALAAPSKPIDPTTCDNQVKVEVNGLVCDFCARALEKVFGKNQAVKGIEVDLDVGEIGIEFHAGQDLDDATIKRMIVDSGYHVVAMQRGCDHAR